jgi:hypothetical protein
MPPPNHPSLRLALRAGLLGGALLDSASALAVLAATWGLTTANAPLTAVSYPWLLSPALLGRAGVQAFACYDRRRYDEAIPWLALTLVLSGVLAWFDRSTERSLVTAYGLLGALQLIAWWRTRP